MGPQRVSEKGAHRGGRSCARVRRRKWRHTPPPVRLVSPGLGIRKSEAPIQLDAARLHRSDSVEREAPWPKATFGINGFTVPR